MAKLLRPFDTWTTYDGHSGIDYPVGVGTPVRASGPGYISAQAKNPRGGCQRWVIYDDGRCMEYSHLRDFNGPAVGSRVNLGDIVAYAGNTGFSTGPHLHSGVEYPVGTLRRPPSYWEHVEQAANGFVGGSGTGAGGAVEIHQRVVGPNPANGRSAPNTQVPVTQQLNPGTVANMNGWVYGESVQGNNLWYHGAISGDLFWSGGFTSQTTAGLTDMNTPSVGPQQRTARNDVNGRAEPNRSSELRQTLPAGTVGDFNGWTHGELVEDEDRWIRGTHSGDWFWLKAFDPRNVDNLPEIKVEAPPEPPASYTFTAFSPIITDVIPANWMCFENPISVPDPTKRVGFPADQDTVVLHDYGTLGEDTYEGTVSWFQNAAASTSAHFVISYDHRTQMVSLADRAWHAGPKGNGYIGFEIDPVAGYTGTDPVLLDRKRKTIANVNLVLAELRRHYSKALFVYKKHSDFMVTACGDDIHFDDYPQGAITPPVEGDTVEVEIEDLKRWQKASLWETGQEIQEYLN